MLFFLGLIRGGRRKGSSRVFFFFFFFGGRERFQIIPSPIFCKKSLGPSGHVEKRSDSFPPSLFPLSPHHLLRGIRPFLLLPVRIKE